MTSTDKGITWTGHPSPDDSFQRQWNAVAYGNGVFVAVSYGNLTMSSADNGVTWTEHQPSNDGDWNTLSFGNGTFVAISLSLYAAFNRTMSSTDNGSTWAGHLSAF
jgi:hypothetical protein